MIFFLTEDRNEKKKEIFSHPTFIKSGG